MTPVLSIVSPAEMMRLVLVPVDELGTDHARVGPVRLLDEQPHGVGRGGDVVVAEQQVGGALHHAERLIGRGRPAGVGGQPPDEGIGGDGGDAWRGSSAPRRR